MVSLGHSGHLSIFTLLKHLMNAFEVQFFRTSFLHRTKDTGTIQDHAAHQIFESETLLTNAFKEYTYTYMFKTNLELYCTCLFDVQFCQN